MRIGSGWDRHVLIPKVDQEHLTEEEYCSPEKNLWIGGIQISSNTYARAHSDGDVLVHAIIDALLGATALGDIGELFPDTDDRYKNISSMELLEKVRTLLASHGYLPQQIDATIALEAPKLSPYKESIRSSLATALHISPDYVSIKAKTGEGVGPVGTGKAIEASVLAVVREQDPSVWV